VKRLLKQAGITKVDEIKQHVEGQKKMEVHMNAAQNSGMLCKGREWKRCKGIQGQRTEIEGKKCAVTHDNTQKKKVNG